jgi:hypothetical protein
LQVIAPPGVLLTTESEDPAELSWKGWRWAAWDYDGEDWICNFPPRSSRQLDLGEAVGLLPPSRWQWVYERCHRQLLSLIGYITPSASGHVPEDADRARVLATTLIAELKAVFPNGEWDPLLPPLDDQIAVPDCLDTGDAGPGDERVVPLSLGPAMPSDQVVDV